MANKCAICGAEINLFQTQKLADGNCICRKTCRKKGFKVYDYVHANLYGVQAHIAQVERGTKLWNHYFVPRRKTKDKTQKLKRFPRQRKKNANTQTPWREEKTAAAEDNSAVPRFSRILFSPELYDVFDYLGGLFHALYSNVLVRSVESVSARSVVRCGQTHE